MPGVNYGRAVMKMRPDWQDGQTARPLDVVYYQNCLWVCIRETDTLPTTSNTNWMLATRSVESDVTGTVEDQVLTIVKVGAELKAQYKALPTYGIADITGLSAALAGKSDTGHTHAASSITGAALSSRKINTTAPLSGGGDLSADRTVVLNIGNGLKVDSSKLVLSVKEGSGLVMAANGELYFDPSQMPTDQFEALLKSIRVPVWLSKNTTWHVNGTTGNNSNDGATAATAFKTIQAALNYVSENYNLGSYTATISVAAGTYDEDIRAPKYNSSQGVIRILGNSPDDTVLAGGFVAPTGRSAFTLEKMRIKYNGRVTAGASSYYAVMCYTGSQVNLINVACDLTTEAVIVNRSHVWSGGTIQIGSGCSFVGNGLYVWVASGGLIELAANTDINGVYSVATFNGNTLGRFSANANLNGGVTPVITGTVTGKRYTLSLNSVASTNGGGPEYFPGTIDGTISTVSYS